MTPVFGVSIHLGRLPAARDTPTGPADAGRRARAAARVPPPVLT